MSQSQQERCVIKIENLYQILRGENVPPDSVFVIKEIFDTKKCQQWYDLQAIRDATAEQLLKATPKASLEEACRDDKVCAYVIAEYRTWYQQEVFRTLRWRTRAWYSMNDNHVISSAAMGAIFGVLVKSTFAGTLFAGATDALWKMFRNTKKGKTVVPS